MNYSEILENARKNMDSKCKACPVCDGKACGNTMPGPGAKGSGDVSRRNYSAWQRIRLNMDTICENKPVSTDFTMFGEKFSHPFFAGPVGAIAMHYGSRHNDAQYDTDLVSTCAMNGTAAFLGDGTDPEVLSASCRAVKAAHGIGIPTVKPWDRDTIREKMKMVRESGAFAVAMDVDAAGLPFLQNRTPPAGSKTTEELAEIIRDAGKPFIVKGIMTPRGARKAMEAGASAIIVSNHGGRVLDQTPATAEVLPDICREVKGKMLVMVDGGIRTGCDILKALALGADCVLIARPFVTAYYGGERDGITALINKLDSELKEAMKMCGAHSLDEITSDMASIYNW